MHISLLCTTHGRVEAIKRLLGTLARQTYSNFTLLLGIQVEDIEADTPKEGVVSLLHLVEHYKNSFQIVTKRIPLSSLSSARNQLLPFAYGDIIALTDDDCYYPDDCLEKVATFFQENTTAGALIGSEMPDGFPAVTRETRYSLMRNSPSYAIFRKKSVQRIGVFDEDWGLLAPRPPGKVAKKPTTCCGSPPRENLSCVSEISLSAIPLRTRQTRQYAAGLMPTDKAVCACCKSTIFPSGSSLPMCSTRWQPSRLTS